MRPKQYYLFEIHNYGNIHLLSKDTMRIVIQRAAQASVSVDGRLVSEIGKGLFILVGVEVGDTEDDMKWLASKAVVHTRCRT